MAVVTITAQPVTKGDGDAVRTEGIITTVIQAGDARCRSMWRVKWVVGLCLFCGSPTADRSKHAACRASFEMHAAVLAEHRLLGTEPKRKRFFGIFI